MLTVEPTITVTVISIPNTAFSYTIFDRFLSTRRYRPSVCLSVRHTSKTVEVRIMKFSTYGTSTHLVFAFHPEILMGSKRAEPSNKRWLGKQAGFYSFKRQYFENGRRYMYAYKVTIND